MPVQSKGTFSDLLQRSVSAVRVALVEPAATFTAVTPSSAAAGADTLLTSAGAHGLTSAVSVGASIYISAGTGWSVGFHTITAIAVDTTGTTIQIDTPYSASMGTPTIALAGTEVTAVTIAIPPLGINSYIEHDLSFSYTSSANAKIWRVKLDGNILASASLSTSVSSRSLNIISNRGVTNSQIGSFGGSGQHSVGLGIASSSTLTSAVDTTTSTSFIITLNPAAANELMVVERYILLVWR